MVVPPRCGGARPVRDSPVNDGAGAVAASPEIRRPGLFAWGFLSPPHAGGHGFGWGWRRRGGLRVAVGLRV
ncbi:MAG: hypothetical protein EBU21_16030, partial [Proteobacteria bacterium]|nr:hypothetical protein [Pseudomonadota bacterium]